MRSHTRDHANGARRIALNTCASLLAAAALSLAGRAQPAGQLPTPEQVSQVVARLRTSPADAPALDAARVAAFRLAAASRFGDALSLFSAIIEAAPDDPQSTYGAALALFNLGRLEESERTARAAVSLSEKASANATPRAEADARAADALTLLAVVLSVRGAQGEALAAVSRAVELAPRSFDAQFAFGRALYGAGDFAAAARAFRAASELRPGDARARFFLATALEGSGDEGGALKTYAELARLSPGAAEGHLGLGALLVKRGDRLDEGITELTRALSINGDLYEARVALGRALLRAGRPRESLAHLKRAVELAPRNPEPLYQLAIAYRRLGMKAEADAATAAVRNLHEARRGAGAQTVAPPPNRPD